MMGYFGAEQALIERSVYRRITYAALGDLHFGRRWRNRVLSALLSTLPMPGRILDAGCGYGHTMAALQRRYPSSMIDGCDIVAENIRRCTELAQRTDMRSERIWVCDLELEPIPTQYDLVVCMEVLEHIDRWQMAVRNLVEALSPNGHLLIMTPAAGPYQAANQGLRRFNRVRPDDRQGKGQAHVREGFTLAELRAGLEAAGLEIRLGSHGFGPIAMWWHTVFELVRPYYMPFWACVTLPALSITALLERPLTAEGGSLAVIGRKKR
jgi:SAM-dependent methyltransferase